VGGDLMGARPHGGESAQQVMARVTAWADTLDASSGDCLWVVSHAGPMRMLAAHWLG
jgi:alpha-ribazole phosphatase